MSTSKESTSNELPSNSCKHIKRRKRKHETFESNDSPKKCSIKKNQESKQQNSRTVKTSATYSTHKNKNPNRKSQNQEETVSTPQASCSTRHSDEGVLAKCEASHRKRRKTKGNCVTVDSARNSKIKNSGKAGSIHSENKTRKKTKLKKKKKYFTHVKITKKNSCDSDHQSDSVSFYYSLNLILIKIILTVCNRYLL